MKGFNQFSNDFIFLKATPTTAHTDFHMDCGLSIGASLFPYGYQEIHDDILPPITSNNIIQGKIYVIAKTKDRDHTNISDRILIAFPCSVGISGTQEEKVRLIIFKSDATLDTPFLNHVFEFCNGKYWNINNDMQTEYFTLISRIISYENLDQDHLLPLLR